MPKAARISTPVAIPTATSAPGHPLVTIALFSGIGLLLSLVMILSGASAQWF